MPLFPGTPWRPKPRKIAVYIGRNWRSIRKVYVIAEVGRGRIFVEAIGKDGQPVRFNVKRESLRQPDPELFEQLAINSKPKFRTKKNPC